LILTPGTSRHTQSLFGLGPGMDSLTAPDFYPPVAAFALGPLARIRPQLATFPDSKISPFYLL